MLALNKAQIDLKIFEPKTSKFKILENVTESSLVTSHKYYKLVANVVFCYYYVIVETCAHQYLTAVIVLLYMQSSFSQNHEISNSWQSYIVKRHKKRKLKNSQNFFWNKKKTRPSSCQFSSPLPFFSTTYLYCARHFFCSNNVWVLCIFFEAIKN